MSRIVIPNANAEIALAPLVLKSVASAIAAKETALPEFVSKEDVLLVRAIRKDVREVDFVASTETVDSHGDVIDQASWNLKDYLANPIVLYAHDSRELPIGKSVLTAVRDGKLEATIRFSKSTQKANEVWALVEEDVLRAVSVGFRPVDGGYEMRGGEEVWVWRRSILKEISVVPIGSNPDALAKQDEEIRRFKSYARTLSPRSVSPAQTETKNPAGDTGTKGKENMKTAEQLAKELEAEQAAKAELAQKHAAANVRIVEIEGRAEKAEAAKTVAEKALEKANGEIDSLKLAAKTLEGEHSKACSDRDAATKRADEADAKLIELEVDAQVNVKIAPVEREEWIELRKKDKGLFEKMIAKRPDMKLGERVTETDEKVAAKGESEIKEPAPGAASAKGAVDAFNSL